MHRSFLFHGLLAFVLVASLAATGDAQPDKNLLKRVEALEGRVAELEQASEPVYLTVNCGAGEKVADALAEAETTTGYVTIGIEGTCVEEVVVSRDNITIGASPGSGLKAPGPDNSALLLRGARNVTLNSMTLQGDSNSTSSVLHLESSHTIRLNFVQIEGGAVGLSTDKGAEFHASGIIVEGASESGIDVDSASSGHIYGSTIRNNLGTGITVWGYLKLMESDLIDNDAGGLNVIGGSASVMMSTTFLRNGRAFGASQGARIGMGDFSIEGSTIQVADVIGGSHVELTGGRIVDNRSGFLIQDKSRMYINDVQITGTRVGVVFSLWTDSYLSLGGAKISGNLASAITLYDTSVLQAYSSEIIGNSGWGIYCEGPPALARIAISCNNEVNGNSGGNNNCPDATPWWFCNP